MDDQSVSVVIPAYKAAHTIARAVDSVLAQTHAASQILVVDDGSPDDLPAALRKYGSAVTYIRKENGNAASARNQGIDLATSAHIAFLDADDYWEPHKLRTQLDVFQRHPEVGTVAGRFHEEPPGEPRRTPAVSSPGWYNRVLRLDPANTWEIVTRIWTGTVMVRRKVLGNERFVSGLEPAEDRDLWVRLAAAAPVYLLEEPLATAVWEPGSLSRTQIDRDYGNMLRVLDRHHQLSGPAAQRYWRARVYRQWAAAYLGNQQPRQAVVPALKRWQLNPLSWEAQRIVLAALVRSCTTGRPRG